MAELLQIPITTVQYWWQEGLIPRKRQRAVFRALTENGIEVSPLDFIDLPPDTSPKKERKK